MCRVYGKVNCSEKNMLFFGNNNVLSLSVIIREITVSTLRSFVRFTTLRNVLRCTAFLQELGSVKFCCSQI